MNTDNFKSNSHKGHRGRRENLVGFSVSSVVKVFDLDLIRVHLCLSVVKEWF